MRKHRFVLFIFLIPFIICCTKKKELFQSSKTLKLNFTQSPPTLDPRRSGDIVSSTFVFMMFEGLTKITPESTSEPALAKHIDLSEDGLCYTFTIKDAYWSNGDPITSYDFEQSWKSLLDPSFPAPNANLLYPIKNALLAKKGLCPIDEIGISCPNNKTLIVNLEKPTEYFLELTSFCTYFPVHPSFLSRVNNDVANESLISSGPFILKYLKKNDEAFLIKNPYYYDRGYVDVNQIHISFVNDDRVAFEMFKKGEIDLVGASFSQLPLEAIEDPLFKQNLVNTPIGSSLFCSFNTKKFPLNNASIRKALALSINRKEIVENITQLNETIATQLIPPVLKGNDSSPLYDDFNPEKAKELFEMGLQELQINKKDFPSLTYIYIKTHYFTKIAQAIQEQWRKTLGVDVILIGYDFKIFIDNLVNRNYQIGQAIWIAQYNNPMDILDRFRIKENLKNYPGWENQEFNNVLTLIEKTQNPLEKQSYIRVAENILIQDSPITCIYHYNYSYLSKNNIKNFYISPIGSIHLNYIRMD